jgi:hypothetical protein
MRYEHVFCGWSKRLKPNESRCAFIRSAGFRFAEMHLAVARTPGIT